METTKARSHVISPERGEYVVQPTSTTPGWWIMGTTGHALPARSTRESLRESETPFADRNVLHYLAGINERIGIADRIIASQTDTTHSHYCEHNKFTTVHGGIVTAIDQNNHWRAEKQSEHYNAIRMQAFPRVLAYDGYSCPEHIASMDPSAQWLEGLQRSSDAAFRLKDQARALRVSDNLLAMCELRDLPATALQLLDLFIRLGSAVRTAEVSKGILGRIGKIKRVGPRGYHYEKLSAVDALNALRKYSLREVKRMFRTSAGIHLLASFGIQPTLRDIEQTWRPLVKELRSGVKEPPIRSVLKIMKGTRLRAPYRLEQADELPSPWTYPTLLPDEIHAQGLWNGTVWGSFANAPIGAVTDWWSYDWLNSASARSSWSSSAKYRNSCVLHGVAYGSLSEDWAITKAEYDHIASLWGGGTFAVSAWEMTRFSFMVDWFFDIGSRIKGLTRALASMGAYHTMKMNEGVWRSTRQTIERQGYVPEQSTEYELYAGAYIRGTAKHRAPVGWQTISEEIRYSRELCPFELQMPQLRVEISPFKVGIIAALVLSKLRG